MARIITPCLQLDLRRSKWHSRTFRSRALLEELGANLVRDLCLGDIHMDNQCLFIVVPRVDIESCTIGPTLDALSVLVRSPQDAANWRERVDILFEGFDDSPAELFEIESVRRFVQMLDDQFPYWLYFLSKAHLGLQCILLCLLPPFLTEEAKARYFPDAIGSLLLDRWFPAMNYICAYVSMDEKEIEALSRRSMDYFRAA